MSRRLFDLVVAILALTVLWPLWALAVLLIKLDSPGPAVFGQRRIGYKGRPFTCYKFRTMAAAAQESPYSERIDDFRSFVFNPPRLDPRVTGVGRILRRTTLDELPQLLNVVRGDMALVGPRPELPEIVAQYPPEYHSRHRVKPGMAGLAIANGRADLTYHEAIIYDLDYVEHHPFRRDLAILARTAVAVLRGEGAR